MAKCNWTMAEAQTWVSEHKDVGGDETETKEMLAIRYESGDEIPELDAAAEKLGDQIEVVVTDNTDLGKEKSQVDVAFVRKEGGELTEVVDSEDSVIPDEVVEKAIESPPESEHKTFDNDLIRKATEYKERWNLSLSKAFDIADHDFPPSNDEYDLVSKFLDCKIKDIFMNDFTVPSALLGSFLTGLDEQFKDYELLDTRDITPWGSERPPHREVIQLTSEKSDDFLISGMEFYEKDGVRMIKKTYPTWGGMRVTLYSKNTETEADTSKSILEATYKWVDENNFLKGEKFALSGAFIGKSEDDWTDLFLAEKNEVAMRRSVDLLNKKGAELANRGIMLIGPPGTGKTLSGRIIRNISDSTFIWVSSRDFSNAGSAGGLNYAFGLAKKLAPTVLFIEDIDHWLSERSTDLLKTEMDGLVQSKGVLTILTSNYPEKLPEALIDRPGRFHDLLDFALPNKEIRVKMIKAWAPDAEEMEDVISKTSGFSGAHMFELISFAKVISVEDEVSMTEAIQISLQKIIEQRELIDRIQSGKKSPPDEGFFEYEEDEKDATIIDISNKEKIETIKKSGRVLSKKTRKILSNAVEGMSKAVSALGEFIEAVDSKPDTQENEKNGVEEELTFDAEDVKTAITAVMKDLLPKKTNASEIVKERMDRAKGKIF